MATPDPDDDDPPTDTTAEKSHQTALKRFKLSVDAYDKQRKRESEDLKFAAGEQWPSEVIAMRTGSVERGLSIGGRPMLTVNALKQPIQQLENQQRSARLAVNITPKSGGASKAAAEVRQGLYRAIETESRADIARSWAYRRAIICGRGFYRVRTDYANDGDNDQDILIERILNQASVYPDPYAQQPDNSDMEWCFVTEDMPLERYKRKYGTRDDGSPSKLALMEDSDLTSLQDDQPEWVQDDAAGGKTVRVAEYWHTTYTTSTRTKKDTAAYTPRETEAREVHCEIINAVETVKTYDYQGRYIPIITVVGNEDNLDGKRVWSGIVRPAMDAQRLLNYELSNLVETVALAPKAPFIVAEGQFENYEQWWKQANVRNFPYLPYKPITISGQQAPPPQRLFGEPPIQAIAKSVDSAEHFINMTSGYFGPSRGQLTSERSGKAIQALQRQSETGNQGYLDQLASVSMTYEAKVVLDLMTFIYDRPGRVARVLGVNDEPGAVMLGKPFAKDVNGQPVEVPEGGVLPPGVPPTAKVEQYDLTADEEYSVTVSVGKSYTTLREEAAETIGNLIQAEPALLNLIGDIWIKNQDFPGSDDIADRLKKMLPPPLQPKEEGGPPPIPPQVQQQMQLMQQQMQELQAKADANMAKLEQAKLEAESKERIAAAKLQADHAIEELKQAAAVQLAQIKAQAEGSRTAMQAQAEMDRTRAELTSDHALADREHAHAVVQQALAPQPSNGGAE